LYPEIEPYDRGLLDVGDGNQVYWEICGNPEGKPALVLHGGPGSGCTSWHRRLFDPAAYRVVLFDQRNSGRSTPHASEPDVSLAHNTTSHLLEDIDRLREHLGIDRWLLLGGSWGSTLALAYAEQHPDRVTALILFGVTTGRHSEFDHLFRGALSDAFPTQWHRLRALLPADTPDHDVPAAYHRLLMNPDPAIHSEAAYEWCLWESATPDWPLSNELARRFHDPAYALAFARIVTHYVTNNAWLEDGSLLRDAGRLADIPGILINGLHDFQAPVINAEALREVWPSAELVVVKDAGHDAANASLTMELVKATDTFAVPDNDRG
jgi:proline iminopeptidase